MMRLENRFEVRQGDLAQLHVDAIVNAANSSLLGGGGVDGAIHRAAGPELLQACRAIGGCPTGEARLTEGFRLPAQYVIHTVGPIYRGRSEDERLLASCYISSLRLARQNGVGSIAFPAISCGAYGYPIEQACQVAVDTCVMFLQRNALPKTVVFVLFSEEHTGHYTHALSAALASSQPSRK